MKIDFSVKHFKWVLLITGLLTIVACKKKDNTTNTPDDNSQQTDSFYYGGNNLNLTFKNVVGDEAMVFKTANDSGKTYVNYANEPFKITKLKYYVSNIKLITSSDDTVPVSPNYHLIDASLGDYQTTLNTNNKTYKAITFLLGVDSIRNVSGAQTGALDPAHGMFWGWNTGYIMAMFEGACELSSTGVFMFHSGGFKGEHSVLSYVTIPFDQAISTIDGDLNLTLTADAQKWFNGTHDVTIASEEIVESYGPIARKIADNYAQMFTKYEVN